MKLRAVIFDIYKTLLDVAPPPADAPARWDELWREQMGTPVRLGLEDFSAGCRLAVGRDHEAAREAGIAFPEVYWPDIVREVLPELKHLPGARQDAFMDQQIGLWHTVRLAPDAPAVLGQAQKAGLLLGIASNCQPYSLRELDRGLAAAGLDRGMFHPEICFHSFEAGFGKPDPYVFRWLTARLRGLGIRAAETLMVGDRADNDIAPAQAQGWQTWHLTPEPEGPDAGGWRELAAAVTHRTR